MLSVKRALGVAKWLKTTDLKDPAQRTILFPPVSGQSTMLQRQGVNTRLWHRDKMMHE